MFIFQGQNLNFSEFFIFLSLVSISWLHQLLFQVYELLSLLKDQVL